MDVKEYLEKYQTNIFNFFSKTLNDNRIPHSMIFTGAPGTLLKETAVYIAKSFLCPHKSPFACGHCKSCNQIDKNMNSHLYIYDTKNGDQIKKGDFSEMFGNFNFSSADTNIKDYFYIINEAENLNDKILNSLLKVLEEPNSNVYAILTTHNEYKLLDTIKSRCRKFKFKLISRETIIENCLQKNIDSIDAQLLSKIYNSADLIEIISKDELYQNAKNMFLSEINALPHDIDKMFFQTIQGFRNKNLNVKETRLFLELLSVFFEEVCAYHYKKQIYLTSLKPYIEKAAVIPIKQIFKGIKLISETNLKLDYNCNISLLLDNLNYSLKSK